MKLHALPLYTSSLVPKDFDTKSDPEHIDEKWVFLPLRLHCLPVEICQ